MTDKEESLKNNIKWYKNYAFKEDENLGDWNKIFDEYSKSWGNKLI